MHLIRKISLFAAKTVLAIILIAVLAVIVTSISPIYDFKAPEPFSGPDVFNPYRNLDTAHCWKRANFHTHTKVEGPLNECAHWPDEVHHALSRFGYDIITFSNHNALTGHPFDSTLQVNVYEHGYNLFKYHKLVFGSKEVNRFDHLVPLIPSQKQFQIDLLSRDSDFITMNHPLRVRGTTKELMEKIGGYELIELDSGISTENEYWDWALSAGHYSFALANDDLHYPDRSHCIAVRCNFLCCPSGCYEDIRRTLLARDSVTALIADASATYTTAGVKAIVDHAPTGKLYEILPNYLFRTGVDVVWRTSNWGEPPVHIEKYRKVEDLKKMYPEADAAYDGILLEGLSEEVKSSGKDKVFIVLHTSTSHGPTYNKKYPAEFEKFTPVCNTVEMSKVNPEELNNAYDNSIRYTDFLIHSTIEAMKGLKDWNSCVLFVSDHGESLGENNLYMHGVPMSMAPREQVEIPFIVWTSDSNVKVKNQKVGHYHVFHSVLDFFGVQSPVFDSGMTIFE